MTVNFSKLTKYEWFDQFDFTPNEYIEVDDNEPVADKMTDREIFEIITRVENVQEDLLEEDINTEQSNVVSIKEAIEGLDTVVFFCDR